MITERLKQEIINHCQNIQCGAKLAAEFSFIHRLNEDFDEVLETIKLFDEIKYLFIDMPEEFAKDGWRNCYLFKYERVGCLIKEIEGIEDKNSHLYHFALGKLFGYNDYEVMVFLKDNCVNFYT